MRSFTRKNFIFFVFILFLFLNTFAQLKELSQEDMLSILVLELKDVLNENNASYLLSFEKETSKDFRDQLKDSLISLNRSLSSENINNVDLLKIKELIDTINSLIEPESILMTIRDISKNTGGNKVRNDKKLFLQYDEKRSKIGLFSKSSDISIEQIAPVFKEILDVKERTGELNIYNSAAFQGDSLVIENNGESLELTSLLDIKGKNVNLCFSGNIEDRKTFPEKPGDMVSFFRKENIIIPSSASLGGGISFSENAFYIMSGDFVFDLIKISEKNIKLKIFPYYKSPLLYGVKFYPEKNNLTKIFRIDTKLAEKNRMFLSYVINIDNIESKKVLKDLFKKRISLRNVPDFEDTADSFLASEKLLSLIDIENIFQKERGLDPIKRRVSKEDVSGEIVPDYGLDSKISDIKLKNGQFLTEIIYKDRDENKRKVSVLSKVREKSVSNEIGSYRDKNDVGIVFLRSNKKDYLLSQRFIDDKNCLRDEMKKDFYNIISSVAPTSAIKELLLVNDSYDILQGYRLKQNILYEFSNKSILKDDLKEKVKAFFADLSQYLDCLSEQEKRDLQNNIRLLIGMVLENNKMDIERNIKKIMLEKPDDNILIFLENIGVLKRLAADISVEAKGIKPVELREKNVDYYVDVSQLLSLYRFF